jgi:nitrate reductase delta subunit
MINLRTTEAIYELLACLMEYPTSDLPDQARECAAALKTKRSHAARHMAHFRDSVTQTGPGDLEELYSATFDLTPVCYPYIGYQLFGDTYKRGEFLALLNARYRDIGIVIQGELPDHLGMVLRYLAQIPDADLVNEGVIPTLERMIEQLKDNPYRELVQAILAVLQEYD